MNFLIFILFLTISLCDSIVYNEEEDYEEVFEPLCDIDFDGEVDCNKFLSFASTNWHQNDYRGCVDQYKTALYCNCLDGNEVTIYKYLGRAFIEIGKLDSAHWSLEKGLRYSPDDESLLEIAAWNAGKLKKFEDQMYYLDRLLEINPENTKALERMSDTYKNNEMYEEQINILNIWLKVDGNNKKALADKKIAYSKLGIDASSIDKERWEKDKSNIQYGLNYAESLIQKDENEKAIEICNDLLVYDSSDKRLLKTVANAYLNIYEDKKALEYLEKLAQVDVSNLDLMLEISEVAVNAEDFKKAYQWVNKGIAKGKSLGKMFFQRAEVLVALVETHQSDDIDFCDRLIYDLAWEDYNSSYNNGYLNARIYMNQLEDFVSTKGDWFLNADGKVEISPSSDECKKLKKSDCYLWVNRTINTKNQ